MTKVTKWTGWHFRCEECGRTARVSEEALAFQREQCGDDSVTDMQLASDLQICLDCLGDTHEGEHVVDMRYETEIMGNFVMWGRLPVCEFRDDSPVFKQDRSFNPETLRALAAYLLTLADGATR